MVIYEHNKINGNPYIRVTSDNENHFVKVKGSENEPTNEIMIKGEVTELEFDEIYIEPIINDELLDEEEMTLEENGSLS